MSDKRRPGPLRLAPQPTAAVPAASWTEFLLATLKCVIVNAGLPLVVAIDLLTSLGASAVKPVARRRSQRKGGRGGEGDSNVIVLPAGGRSRRGH
jgi:hypothetical protein